MSSAISAPRAAAVTVIEYSRRIIYHSPERPGWTSWVGLWRTLDGRLFCSFHQRTGPQDKPVDSMPILESTDDGSTWNRMEGDMPCGGGRGTLVLGDGTILCPRWTSDPNDTGYVCRCSGGDRTDVQRIYFLPPTEYRTWPTVIHRLRDGRLVLMAGVWARGDGSDPKTRMTKMMFTSDDEGKTWSKPTILMTPEKGASEESDFCELPNGDLFWIHRAEHFPQKRTEIPPGAVRMGDAYPNGYSDRLQSIVKKKGKRWQPMPPVPAQFPHSGFPAVLLTNGGIILHLATDGIYWSNTVGKEWTRLPIDGTGYYPRAVQTRDGKIICIGHIGHDDPYGRVDQAIVQQCFRLRIDYSKHPPAPRDSGLGHE